ncbi:hypothetical protein KR51_00021760 [Rubidibacter lacunae KORDI 51-2]|uniref:Transposase n=1 Tax=Rubidibacter lacunae KORDI 51-2 TaxID=582515 RepID=U5DHZ4_9CHRO|nr:hypothetical protein KR51_00021760 [Rubidibacter lacunae KORDI 51-2]
MWDNLFSRFKKFVRAVMNKDRWLQVLSAWSDSRVALLKCCRAVVEAIASLFGRGRYICSIEEWRLRRA